MIVNEFLLLCNYEKQPIKGTKLARQPLLKCGFAGGCHRFYCYLSLVCIFPESSPPAVALRQATEVAQAPPGTSDNCGRWRFCISQQREERTGEIKRKASVLGELEGVWESEVTAQQQEEQCSFIRPKCQKRGLCGWIEGWSNTTQSECPVPFSSGESRFTLSACDRRKSLKIAW